MTTRPPTAPPMIAPIGTPEGSAVVRLLFISPGPLQVWVVVSKLLMVGLPETEGV